eukprot:gene5081-323_t
MMAPSAIIFSSIVIQCFRTGVQQIEDCGQTQLLVHSQSSVEPQFPQLVWKYSSHQANLTQNLDPMEVYNHKDISQGLNREEVLQGKYKPYYGMSGGGGAGMGFEVTFVERTANGAVATNTTLSGGFGGGGGMTSPDVSSSLGTYVGSGGGGGVQFGAVAEDWPYSNSGILGFVSAAATPFQPRNTCGK